VLGPDGLSRFEELSRREGARTAMLYAFDMIEHEGEDLRNLPFLDWKAALARLLRDTEAGILLNEHIVEGGLSVFRPCLPAWDRRHRLKGGRWHVRSGPRPRLDHGLSAGIAVQRERSEIWNRRAPRVTP
jgi:hypothetical protein